METRNLPAKLKKKSPLIIITKLIHDVLSMGCVCVCVQHLDICVYAVLNSFNFHKDLLQEILSSDFYRWGKAKKKNYHRWDKAFTEELHNSGHTANMLLLLSHVSPVRLCAFP